MHIAIVALVFGVIFIAELPDKSLFASLVLGAKFPWLYVWLGAAAAFLIHVIIAVTAGKLLTLLPHSVLETIITFLFLAGGLIVLFGKQNLEKESASKQTKLPESATFWKVFATAFIVVFLGEWGDITQIATANYAAHYHDPWSVGTGALLALWTVALLGVTIGTKMLKMVPAVLLQRITAAILLLFALVSAWSIFY